METLDAASVLVIGFGNPMRRDDGVGPSVAQAVSRWCIPGVEAIEAHQLLPELAEPLAKARLAVFVDARIAGEGEGDRVEARPIAPADGRETIGHVSDPRRLLALSREVFSRSPEAWLITVPAVDLSIGEGLSPDARQGLREAMRWISRLLVPIDRRPIRRRSPGLGSLSSRSRPRPADESGVRPPSRSGASTRPDWP
ncbi:hydrogenase maturation protease [Tautonia sociabilis]|uniref:Hydrogenase maturation protease n=1 Tax=Tautonia sociabilis TaxID=2080755 RepID=A0A432MGA1_9BACT|nr:hydrogenase maturation protease [Tautonia sociabilis]RUL85627.1 hydrogenase maturation protease [Tautonia sociabilis]